MHSSMQMQILCSGYDAKISDAVVSPIAVPMVDYHSVGNFAVAPKPCEAMSHVTRAVDSDLHVPFALYSPGNTTCKTRRTSSNLPTKLAGSFVVAQQFL